MRCMASAMSEVAAVLQYDEQACQEWVLWRNVVFVVWKCEKAVCNWEKKLQKVLVDDTIAGDHVPISKLSSRACVAWIFSRSFHCRK